ncbi:MAG: hypothetical protein OXU22_09705 [Gammaproteobacteria bacterium]|nr:hypothetical protein [Gammaproteobacteria bacterium]
MTETKTQDKTRHKVRLTGPLVQGGRELEAGDTAELRRDQVERLRDFIAADDVARVLGKKSGAAAKPTAETKGVTTDG